MNPRRAFLGTVAGAWLAASGFARAQAPERVMRVGLLSIGTDPARPERWQPFIDAMREQNFAEGRNLVLLRAFGDGHADRLPALAAGLVNAKVDLVVTTGDREVIAMRAAGPAMPVIFTFVDDPVARGFAASLARPGGNITGFTSLVPGMGQKYVELLKESVPAARRFALIATAANTRPEKRHDYDTAARALGISMTAENVTDGKSYDAALRRAKENGVGGIIAPMDGETFRHRQALVQLALTHRLPGIYGDAAYVEAGGLMSYSSSFADRLRRAAGYAARILRGARAGELPVQQPVQFELVINQKTAQALGVKFPQSIMLRAERVIE